ncbi:MAG: phosphatase PAP2 family protein [Spirochaetes bacterium]|nr:phosphatase PAP2 family protein [Brevinematales bacterium]MCL1958787.1 phosphatase PAP2 family protein [Spirochaetota bacterium]
MEPVLQWGLDFIRAVQTVSCPALTFVMRIITAIGSWAVFLTALTVLYWCVNEKKGMRLCLMLIISLWINMSLKFFLDQPRPFFEGYDPSVGMIYERMGGLPSGHAQNTLVVFFILASWIKKNWVYACAAVLCFLIGFSRIYLGVHFPTDVIAGWIIGGIILCGYFLLYARIEKLLEKGGFRAGMIASAALSFFMILYLPSKELLMPGGAVLGLGAGYYINKKYIGFSSNAPFEKTGTKKYIALFARLLFGTAGFALIFFTGIKFLPQHSANYKLYGFVLAALSGFWVSAASPWVFVRLRLAGTEQKQNV